MQQFFMPTLGMEVIDCLPVQVKWKWQEWVTKGKVPVYLFQSWRRQVYLLQVPHLFILAFYSIYNRWAIYKINIDGDPSIKELW